MPENITDNQLTGKEKRQQKREERQRTRDIKLGEQITREATGAGVDLSQIPTGPLTEKRKQEITESIKSGADKQFVSDIDRFSQLYPKAEIPERRELDPEALKRSLRREKTARIFDAIGALGAGLQGREVDPSKFLSRQLREERAQQYQQYKDVSEAARKTASQFERGYTEDLINYLNTLKKDAATSADQKRKIEKHIADLERTKAETEYTKYRKGRGTQQPKAKPVYTQQMDGGAWQLTNQKNPYSDLYYKLTGNSPVLINEMAKMAGHATDETGALKRNLSTDEIERFSNTILSKAFDIRTDENGNQIAMPKPGMENFMNDLSNNLTQVDNLKRQLEDLDNQEAVEIEEAGMFTREAPIRERYAQQRMNLESQIANTESSIQSMLNGGSTPAPAPRQQASAQASAPAASNDFLKTIEKYK